MASGRHWEQDKEATVYVGNLDERVTDELVWELMLQAGRIVNVHLPKDRVTQTHQGYGFVEYISEEDADYAAKIMNQIRLFGKPIRVNKASADKQKTVEVGAELFIGNLDQMVDERTLLDTFSRFGSILSTKISRDEHGMSRGFGFVSYNSFEASDEAIANMNGQFLANKEITVQYAYKKDGRNERHGDEAERKLAKEAQKHNVAPVPPPQILPAPAPAPIMPAAAAVPGGIPAPVAPPAGFANGYHNVPPPHQQRPAPPTNPLPPPPAGLPSRPPPSQAGYGGPPGYVPPGFGPPGAPTPPPGFGTPPTAPGFAAPPPGFQPPPGVQPPGMPPGFQQGPPGYGRR